MIDKAGREYWNKVWGEKIDVSKIDINYYTNNLLHQLFLKYLPKEKLRICEIGCAMSPYLLYFKDYFDYEIYGFDYDKEAVKKTLYIYNQYGYKANIFYRNFFSNDPFDKVDVLYSMGVFEHFSNLEESIKHTNLYLKDDGIIITIIPNMNGIVGLLQKYLIKKYMIYIFLIQKRICCLLMKKQVIKLFFVIILEFIKEE